MDALIKRFEQLQNGLQDQLFRSLALAEGEDLRDRSRRDLAELMERLGVIESAQAWSELAVLRNRLAHAYPNDKRRQVRVLNETYEATGRVIAAFDRAAARARSRLRRRMVRKKVPAPRRAR